MHTRHRGFLASLCAIGGIYKLRHLIGDEQKDLVCLGVLLLGLYCEAPLGKRERKVSIPGGMAAPSLKLPPLVHMGRRRWKRIGQGSVMALPLLLPSLPQGACMAPGPDLSEGTSSLGEVHSLLQLCVTWLRQLPGPQLFPS